MSKKVVRYFFDFLDGQEKWLNSMAKNGYRLKKCGIATYTFEECNPCEYEYNVEFVGTKSYAKMKDYQQYLEDMGLHTISKNINLNYSIGKVRWRPYAKGMGQIATSPGAFHNELLIIEKKKDGKDLELHTDVKDKLMIYKEVRRAYMWVILMMLGLMAVTFIPSLSHASKSVLWALRGIIAIFGTLFLIPTLRYSSLVNRLQEESTTYQ